MIEKLQWKMTETEVKRGKFIFFPMKWKRRKEKETRQVKNRKQIMNPE